MATRAQQQRYESQRSKAPRPKQPPKRRTSKRRPTDDAGARNLSLHGERSALVVAEESHAGHPSRKTTRKGYVKLATPLTHAKDMRISAPEARHTRRT